MHDVSNELINWARSLAQSQAGALAAMAQCRSPQELMALQVRTVREDISLMMETGARVRQIATTTATQAL
jgi:hypothetical protein